MKKLTIILSLLLLSMSVLKSQPASPVDAFAYFTSNNGQSIGHFEVKLPTNEVIAAIRIKLGSLYDEFEIVDYIFSYDVSNGLPFGYSYVRNDHTVTLCFGNLNRPETMYGEVLLQDSQGNWGQPVQFVTN